MYGHPTEFDQATIAYLKDLDQQSGAGRDGVFIRRSAGPFAGPRDGWLFLLLLGGACLVGSLAVCFSPEKLLTLKNQSWIGWLQAAATALGVLCLLNGVVRYRRPVPAVELGSFIFADGAHLWDVQPQHVRAMRLAELTDANGHHAFSNGAYTGTSVNLTFVIGGWSCQLHGKALAERLVNFLQAQMTIRNAPEPDIRNMAAVAPGLLAALAIRMADNRMGASVSVPGYCPDPPAPHLVSRYDKPAQEPSRQPRCVLAAVAAGVLGIVVFPLLNRYALDERMFAQVPVEYTGNFAAFDRYLIAFPNGRHAAEVRERWDEQLFAQVPAVCNGNFEAFDRYLKRFPDGQHATEVRERWDDQLFSLVPTVSKGHFEAFERYMTTFPEGKHAGEVRQRWDDQLFAQIPLKYNGSFESFDQYFKTFPQGRHVAEARTRREDHVFQRAVAEAEEADSPAALRDYLASADTKRHHEEAWARIGKYYDRAIADLKQRAATSPGKIDNQLLKATLAVLEAMKRARQPIVTVGFKPQFDPEPRTPQQKRLEQREYDFHMKRHPELNAVAERHEDRKAILPRGEVFDADQVTRREKVILGRLTQAVRQGIKQELLKLQSADAGQTPVLEVGYHVYASGQLGPYQRTTVTHRWPNPSLKPAFPGANPLPTKTTKEIVGLVRWYHIKWTISVRPPGAKQPFVYTVDSEPLTRLNYDSQPGDPDWAPYAVILYSGFYDMSARLIRSFGLDPGPAPNAFTFAAVASNKANDPTDPPKEIALPIPEDPPPGKKSLKELYQRLSPAVPIVEPTGAGGGSGFLIQHQDRYLVVTNRHVIARARNGLQVYFLRSVNPGQEERLKVPSAKVKLLAVHRTVDLALIDISAAAEELAAWKIQPLTLAAKDHVVSVGEHVFAIGHPGDANGGVLTRTLSDGIVSAVNRKPAFNRVAYTQVTVPINPGNSGGPIFDDDGKVIAVATMTIRQDRQGNLPLEALNFGLDTRYVHELLDAPGKSLSQAEIAGLLGAGKTQPLGKEVFRRQGSVRGSPERVAVVIGGRSESYQARQYLVALKGGARYYINLATDGFVGSIIVQDASGKQLAYGVFGSSSGLKAHQTFIPPRDGTYRVYAAALVGTGRFTLSISGPSGPRNGPNAPVSAAVRKLQGTWRVTQVEFAGKKVPVPKGMAQMIFSGNRVTLKGDPKGPQSGTYTVDASASPKRITLFIQGARGPETMQGIYETDGNILRIGVGKVRPLTGFDDPNAAIMTLVRGNLSGPPGSVQDRNPAPWIGPNGQPGRPRRPRRLPPSQQGTPW